ncbi:hypothetical protein [Qipengyuania sp. MTN3-11]|uniref:hypothetical protein n=1 Tax=Qipengyuania sp. MTN3-11 TaxID=3056557 RepID=UPI0036F34493
MRMILSAIIVLMAIIDMVIGIGFFLDPARSAVNFGLAPDGAMGRSALRADFTAFFTVAAGFMAWGAWRRRGDLLAAPLALFAVAFTGRLVNLLVVGTYDGWWQPMAVEMAHVLVLVLAIRRWPWRGAGI